MKIKRPKHLTFQNRGKNAPRKTNGSRLPRKDKSSQEVSKSQHNNMKLAEDSFPKALYTANSPISIY